MSAFAVFSFSAFSSELAEREAYDIRIPRIAVGMNDTTGKCSRVRIAFDKSDDYAVISETDDLFVKAGRNSSGKTTYRESASKSYQLTDFEVEQINRVCKGFVEALEDFEKNLQNENRGKCLFLDCYFPNFLNGFYYMMLMARAGSEDIPAEAKINEKLYDISLTSPKTDERVSQWFKSGEYIVSLRIAARELAFEINAWQKKELTNKKRDPEVNYDAAVFKSLVFFERIYFNKGALLQNRK